MSWRLDNRRRFILLLLALGALGMQAVLDYTRTATRQRDYELKLAAADRAELAFAAVREHRGLENASLDLVNDPAGTGLIGPEISLITNATGNLEAKLTTLNPNFAGVMIQYFRQAGLAPGDPVAVAASGSFPGLNICLYAAMEAMDLRPVVVTSVGASNWGANDPEFTWLDMESLFYDSGIFHTRSAAATYGGGNDMGRGLSPAGRQLIQDAIDRNGIPLLASDNIEDAVARRMTFYEQESRGRAYQLYVNIGGGVASLGSSHNRTLLPAGLSFDLGAHNWPRKGTLILFSEKGVPVVHLLQMTNLAREHGLPVAPDYQPQPGEGEIFIREMYRWPLAAAFLAVYCLACVLVLAPEIRRGIFDRLGRRRPSAAAWLLPMLLLPVLAGAADKWQGVEPRRSEGTICLETGDQTFTYYRLVESSPVEFRVYGPRRVKIIARYVSGAGDPERNRFTLIAAMDGDEILRKSFNAPVNEDVSVCDGGAAVSSLRRAYLDVPKGRHMIRLTAETEGSGTVTSRLFRSIKTRSSATVPFSPERFRELATLQFDSGTQSTYYRFDAGEPLAFSVSGPTRLKLYTRLDFESGMLGRQKYALEIWRDGEPWRTFHYDVTRLANAFYPERLDMLPGIRKELGITVPDGRHQYEVRCVRPTACSIAAQIRIPKHDLQEGP